MYYKRIKVFWCLGVISSVLSGINCIGRDNGDGLGVVGEAQLLTVPRRAINGNVAHANGIRKGRMIDGAKGRPVLIPREVHPRSVLQRRQQPPYQRGINQLTGGENQAQQQIFLQQQQQQNYQQQLLQQHQQLQQEQAQLQQQIHLHHQRLIENQVQQHLLVQHASQQPIVNDQRATEQRQQNEQQVQQAILLRQQAENQAYLNRAAEQERKLYLQKKRREQERQRRFPADPQRIRIQRGKQRELARGQQPNLANNPPTPQDQLVGSSSQQQQNWVYQQQALADGNVQQQLVKPNKRRPKMVRQQKFRKPRLVKLIRIPKQRTKRQRVVRKHV